MKELVFFILLISLNYIYLGLPFMNIILENDALPTKTLYIYGHMNPDTDSIISSIVLTDLLKKMGEPKNIIPCRIGKINKETQFVLDLFKKESPKLISDLSGADEVILVDHNSPSQSLDFKNANIIGLIDHHAISGFETTDPITIITKPVGCTCTILYDLYKQKNITISKDIAGLIISAIISDTLLLKTSVTTQEDIDAVEFLADYIDMDYITFGQSLLKAGADISDLDEYQIINYDLKLYNVNGYMINIACINSFNPIEVLERKEKLLKEINKLIDSKKLDLFLLVIVNIDELNSNAIVSGRLTKVFETAFDVEINENEAFLKGITSRKKEVYPRIAKILNDLPKNNIYYLNLGVILFLSIFLLI